MTQVRQSTTSSFWLSLFLLFMTCITSATAQTEESATVPLAEIADSEVQLRRNALALADTMPATMALAGENDNDLRATSLSPTTSFSFTSPEAMGLAAVEPPAALETGVPPGALNDTPVASTTGIPPEELTDTRLAGLTETSPAVKTVLPDDGRVSAAIPTSTTEMTTAALATTNTTTEATAAALVATNGLVSATPVATNGLASATPVATGENITPPSNTAEAPTAALVAIDAPPTAPVTNQSLATAPIAAPGSVATTQAPEASITTAAPPTVTIGATTPAVTSIFPATTPTDNTMAYHPPVSSQPITASSPRASTSAANLSDLDLAPENGSTSTSNIAVVATPNTQDNSRTGTQDNSRIDTSMGDIVETSEVLTLAPIMPDDTDTDAKAKAKADPEASTSNHDSNSDPTTVATLSSHSQSFGGWPLALVIVCAICVVVASVFFTHRHHVRTTAANRRIRNSVEQRALESFFLQNRLTVARETEGSSRNFVTDPLTPREDIAVAMSIAKASEQSRISAAQGLNHSTQLDIARCINTPMETSQHNAYESFTDRKLSIVASPNFAVTYSDYSKTSSMSLGSIAPSNISSQDSVQPLTFDDGSQKTNWSDRFSSISSVSNTISDSDPYHVRYQSSGNLTLPVATSETFESTSDKNFMSRMSDDFSVDESYTDSFTTHLSANSASSNTFDSFCTESTPYTDDNDEDPITNSDVSMKCKQSEGV